MGWIWGLFVFGIASNGPVSIPFPSPGKMFQTRHSVQTSVTSFEFFTHTSRINWLLNSLHLLGYKTATFHFHLPLNPLNLSPVISTPLNQPFLFLPILCGSHLSSSSPKSLVCLSSFSSFIPWNKKESKSLIFLPDYLFWRRKNHFNTKCQVGLVQLEMT